MAHPYAEHRSENRAKAHKMLHSTGNHFQHRADGGRLEDDKSDRKMVKSAVRQHEDHEHGGEHTKLKLARGGAAKKGTKVNVIVAPQTGNPAAEQMAHKTGLQQGMQLGARAAAGAPRPPAAPAAAAGPGAPMPPGPGAGARPMGAMPGQGGMPGMVRKRGGKIPHIDAGGGGAQGRIEKARAYGEHGMQPKSRKSAGKKR